MNTDDARTVDVLAVTVTFPVAAAGIVIEVLNAPRDVVRKESTADPATTVPEVETLNPVPVTFTAEPAGPVAWLSEIRAAGAAWPGPTPAKDKPNTIITAVARILTNLNTVIDSPQSSMPPLKQPPSSVPASTSLILRAAGAAFIKIS